jgi:hypothetical protein
LTLPLFVLPVYYPYLPITTLDRDEIPVEQRLDLDLVPGIKLVGYTLPPVSTAGDGIPVTLTWQATARIDRDHLVGVCLHDPAGRPVCRWGHPADGRYPTRAWEEGYLIRDETLLPTPRCLPPGEYQLSLLLQPLRLDTATTARVALSPASSVALGEVRMTGTQLTQPPKREVWTGTERYEQGEVRLPQIRQAVTVIDYGTVPAGPVSLADSTGANGWTQISPPLIYPCPQGPPATIHSFIVDPGVQPGTYAVPVHDQSQRNLRLDVATRARNYRPPPDIPVPLNASLGGQVELLGYNLDLSPRWPGQTVDIDIFWRSLNTMDRRYVASFHLLDNTMAMWGQIDHVLGANFEYPNVLWAPGEVISQTFALPVGRSAPPGLYTIEFGMYDNSAGDFEFLPITLAPGEEPVKQLHLGPVRILDPARTRPPDYPLSIRLGDRIEMLGYDLSAEALMKSGTLEVTLHWRAVGQPQQDYTVFTQLIGPDGRVWAQQDNPPQGGRYPTTAWAANDRVVDRYRLRLQEDAPPGAYRLLVGMYDPATGQRLPAIDHDGHPIPEIAIHLTSLTVEWPK